ncbi:MAG: restriction endonuclease, SacI family [Planctomycetes bacterium]|nr:restriction endonuclease, SacI family [Planctomycetota bacterium]
MTEKETTFVEQCKEFLRSEWEVVVASLEAGVFCDPLLPENEALRDHIVACLTSQTKSYRYVLPTQVLCKCVDPSVDSHSLQAGYDQPGAFDARTIAHKVIVPFDQESHRVLGGSPEPYVNNPLRCPAVTARYRTQQKNREDWDRLIAVLDVVEEAGTEELTRNVFDQILAEIYRLLAGVRVAYPTPNRISLAQTMDMVKEFTGARSGGDRAEAVCTALFRAIACEFGLFDEILRQKVNVADSTSGMGADVECRLHGVVVLLVEVKDRALTMTQLDSKLDGARARRISEILFLVEQGISREDRPEVQERIKNEFGSGQNAYVSSFEDFSRGVLILLGEKGRVRFLSFVGEELERAGSDITHRRAWAQLLKST